MICLLFALLVLFQIKHFIADYPLQGKYMLGKFKDHGWIIPLSIHCLVHSTITFIISAFLVSLKTAILLALLDFITHFIIDRVKASPKMLGRYKIEQKQFWWTLGLDQMMHHLVHYLIIFLIIWNI